MVFIRFVVISACALYLCIRQKCIAVMTITRDGWEPRYVIGKWRALCQTTAFHDSVRLRLIWRITSLDDWSRLRFIYLSLYLIHVQRTLTQILHSNDETLFHHIQHRLRIAPSRNESNQFKPKRYCPHKYDSTTRFQIPGKAKKDNWFRVNGCSQKNS